MTTNLPPMPPAGWYPDTEQPSGLRYWDGRACTDHRSTNQGPSSYDHVHNHPQGFATANAPGRPLIGSQGLNRQWRAFSEWFTRGRGWTDGYIAVATVIATVGAALAMIAGLVFIGALGNATQNSCDRAREIGAERTTVDGMERFLKEYDRCSEWLLDHPEHLDEYSDLYDEH